MNKTTAQNALNALELYVEAGHGNSKCTDAQGMACIKAAESIAELKAVIAQPVEPVGFADKNLLAEFLKNSNTSHLVLSREKEEEDDSEVPLYTAPQEPAAPAPVEQAGEIKAWGVIYNTGSGTYQVRIDEPDSDHANVGFKEPLYAASSPVNAELLEALKSIVEMEGTENNEWDGVERVIPEMCDIARAAIKKAEGAA